MAATFGAALGWLAGVVFRVRRADVERHLTIAFPDRSARWRRRVGRASYRHLGREGVAMLRMAEMERSDLLERTAVRGLGPVRDALAEERGVVFLTGHLGNWEIGGAAVSARGVPLAVVALRQANPLFDRELVRTRERLGMRVIYRRNAPAEVLSVLRRGGAVALVADQNPARGGIPAEFFGRPANTARGPGVLALRADARVFLGVAFRTSGGEPAYEVRFEELPVERTGELDRDVRDLVQVYTSRLEEAVREAPEQYFWQHRRWKERP